ncbi:unnamed protein product, partial [Rotaria socialis]
DLASTCLDIVINQDETDLDCGGSTCPQCIDTKLCSAASDCVSGVCSSNICQAPTCRDGVKNQDETDIDCGGSTCPQCPNDKICSVGSDCISRTCSSNMCQASTCSDGVKNQDETDMDCGGSICPQCVDTKLCNVAPDCVSGVCLSNICRAPTCSDGVINQDETDMDCGGSTCPGCADSKTCNVGPDCVSGVCLSKICQAPTCSDGVKNQDETDIDCGGSKCGKCEKGKGCNVASECFSGECSSNVCQMCSLSSFVNGGFESGNSDGWIVGGGKRKSILSSEIQPKDYFPGGLHYDSSTATQHSSIVSSKEDTVLKSLMPKTTHTGKYAWRIEDLDKGGAVSVISQQITNYFCLNIYFAWLAVLENGNHVAINSSVMIIELKDETVGDTLLTRRYDAGAGSNGVDNRFKQSKAYFYTPAWQIEHLSIDSSRTGHNFTLTVLAADCRPSGHKGYVYIDSFGGVAP